MRIIVGDIYSTLETRDLRVLMIVRGVCRARPKGFQFMPAYKERRWDGYISLMNGSKFPTGMMTPVVGALRKEGYDPKLVWPERVAPEHEEIAPDALQGITLRPYQLKAAERLLEAQRGIAKMATNSGKTEVMAALVWAISKPTLVVLHRKELLYQTAERFRERLDYSVGMVGDGNREWGFITVAMVQTLSNIIDSEEAQDVLRHNAVLMVDECHTASSNQMMDVLFQVPGQYRYGFSGTPLRHQDLADAKLISITGKVQVEVTNEQLIERGYSAEPYVHVHVMEDYHEDGWELEYHDAYQRYIVENDKRNDAISRIAGQADGVVLVIVERIEHGRILNGIISNSAFVNGSDSTDYRQSILEKMREGNTGAYIATSIFDEGIDVPSVGTLIIAAGGKSHIKVLQRVGRGLRQKEGENVLHVHDFLDDTNKYLFDQSEARISIYEDEGFQLEILQASDSPALL